MINEVLVVAVVLYQVMAVGSIFFITLISAVKWISNRNEQKGKTTWRG